MGKHDAVAHFIILKHAFDAEISRGIAMPMHHRNRFDSLKIARLIDDFRLPSELGPELYAIRAAFDECIAEGRRGSTDRPSTVDRTKAATARKMLALLVRDERLFGPDFVAVSPEEQPDESVILTIEPGTSEKLRRALVEFLATPRSRQSGRPVAAITAAHQALEAALSEADVHMSQARQTHLAERLFEGVGDLNSGESHRDQVRRARQRAALGKTRKR